MTARIEVLAVADMRLQSLGAFEFPSIFQVFADGVKNS
jgi:hypothetical protein